MAGMRRKPNAAGAGGMAGGTLLTGPTGLQAGAANVGGGAKSLLGA